ncbi:MAG: YggS family pyridoxal phosphate-dependent enzyme [Chloroflexota bacterium]
MISDGVAELAAARAEVLGRIARAGVRARRDPAGVTLVAVSKTVPADRVRTAVAAGLTVLGENRVQEAAGKIPEVPGATWHLVGPLQSNKVRRALELFDVIESVHDEALASRLDGIARATLGRQRVPILLQVNVDRDPAKAGFSPEGLEAALERLDRLEALDIRGLMTIGRLVADPEAARPTFVALRALSAWLRARWPRLGPELSMGMTDDYEVAVEEGATIVRVGRALFGERPAAGAPRAPGAARGRW